MFGLFLSTPSARRATFFPASCRTTYTDFYPRPPRGGRPCLGRAFCVKFRFLSTPSARRATDSWCRTSQRGTISIHALREEGDPTTMKMQASHSGFLSTPSARRATDRRNAFIHDKAISIHALREEGDGNPAAFRRSSHHFYPRPPRGGRPYFIRVAALLQNFYPRPPRGGRPRMPAGDFHFSAISIHALREEGDQRRMLPVRSEDHFYPRPPRGGRPSALSRCAAPAEFLSTPSARRATAPSLRLRSGPGISIHALREEGDHPPPCCRHRGR